MNQFKAVAFRNGRRHYKLTDALQSKDQSWFTSHQTHRNNFAHKRIGDTDIVIVARKNLKPENCVQCRCNDITISTDQAPLDCPDNFIS